MRNGGHIITMLLLFYYLIGCVITLTVLVVVIFDGEISKLSKTTLEPFIVAGEILSKFYLEPKKSWI